MKTLIALLLISIVSVGCSKPLTVNGKTYPPYGLANKELEDPNVVYSISKTDVIVGLIASETLFVPGYMIAFDIYEPQGLKDPTKK